MGTETKKTSGPRVKCNGCGDVIQSMHRHDFVWCKCKEIAIDGGSSYTKMSFDPKGPGYEFLDKEKKK